MTPLDQAIALRNRAFALREVQDMEPAFALISEAAKLLPDDPQTAFAHAQIAFETGRPATALFEAARLHNANNPAFIRNCAAAYASEGQIDAAIAQLEAMLAAQPEWLDGHRQLANLRATTGDPDPAQSYARAVKAKPDSLSLRLAWFHHLSIVRDWTEARNVLEDAGHLLGQQQALELARVFAASESGEAAGDPQLFDHLAEVRDPGLDLCQTRHWLRHGDPVRAETYAARHIGQAAEAAFWPYLSLIWRLRGDPRAQWLDRPDSFIQSFDLNYSDAELQQLAQTLHRLHTARAPFLEQSVRGGTQTDGNLLLRHEPAIQLVRTRVQEAVRTYIDGLPAREDGHPLLSQRRDTVLFEGSWSVRLAAQGFHTRHTHTKGWISSALYVALPPQDALGPPPAGWIEFGTPPSELGVDLPPYQRVEPAPARLVLFPSTMWHGTIPFADGERLTVAFDVRRPL